MLKDFKIIIFSFIFIIGIVFPQTTLATGIIPSDLNVNGKVDIFDYNKMFSYYGFAGDTSVMNADIDKDGKVGINDYNTLVSDFGKTSHPEPEISITTALQTIKEYFNDDAYRMDAEITPWNLNNGSLGGDHLYLTSTYDTYMCSTAKNIFTLTTWDNLATGNTCKLRQSSTFTPFSPPNISDDPLWKRDYYGSFSGHILLTKLAGAVLYSINHGELLNNNYHAPVQPCRLAPDIGYGALPCDSIYTSASYNAFVGMSSFPWTLANYNSGNLFTDLGPIAWPANGYVETVGGVTMKATNLGILHPTSIIKDGFIYVFYRDNSQGSDLDGRGSGLKVVRAPILDTGIDPLSFKTFYQETFSDQALPVGFNKDQIRTFFSKKGGRSSSIFSNETFFDPAKNIVGSNRPPGISIPKTFSFSVAKVKGSKLYLGVSNDLTLGVTLRTSRDLVHWSNPTVVMSMNNYYNGGVDLSKDTLLYARLANTNGDSYNDIDPNDFYVIGMQVGPHPFVSGQEAHLLKAIRLKLLNVDVN